MKLRSDEGLQNPPTAPPTRVHVVVALLASSESKIKLL